MTYTLASRGRDDLEFLSDRLGREKGNSVGIIGMTYKRIIPMKKGKHGVR